MASSPYKQRPAAVKAFARPSIPPSRLVPRIGIGDLPGTARLIGLVNGLPPIAVGTVIADFGIGVAPKADIAASRLRSLFSAAHLRAH